MSDTPRTKEQTAWAETGIVRACFAEQLERELNEANSIIRQQQLLDEENLGLKERIKRLEDIIKRAATRFFADGSDGKTVSDMLKILDEAREAKP